MKKTILIMLALFSLGQININAQSIDKHYLERLSVGKNEVLTVTTDSLYIGTLIMEKNSELRFEQSTKIIVDHAYLDKNCKFDASGSKGKNGKLIKQTKNQQDLNAADGSNGSDGYDLEVVIVFEALGSLNIDTSGGNGGRGADGGWAGEGQRPVYNASVAQRHVAPVLVKGRDAGNGGSGGNAGDLQLYYQSNVSALRLNDFGIHKLNQHDGSINLIYSGGMSGSAGKAGSGYSQYGYPGSVFSGENLRPGDLDGDAGTLGQEGLNGKLTLKRMPF